VVGELRDGAVEEIILKSVIVGEVCSNVTEGLDIFWCIGNACACACAGIYGALVIGIRLVLLKFEDSRDLI
jgi:hypothetical protein